MKNNLIICSLVMILARAEECPKCLTQAYLETINNIPSHMDQLLQLLRDIVDRHKEIEAFIKNSYNEEHVVGSKGDLGVKGKTGVQGQRGDTGQSYAGATGLPGPIGRTGYPGEQGSPGEHGPLALHIFNSKTLNRRKRSGEGFLTDFEKLDVTKKYIFKENSQNLFKKTVSHCHSMSYDVFSFQLEKAKKANKKFENLSFKLEGVWKKMNEMFVFYEQVVSSYEKKKNNFKGYVGAYGPVGTAGVKGSPGKDQLGHTGVVGSKGPVGYTGSPGVSGITGPAGYPIPYNPLVTIKMTQEITICSLEGCQRCHTNNVCAQCDNGYLLSNNNCYAQCNVDNCAQCSVPNTCIACAPGYNLDRNFNCIPTLSDKCNSLIAKRTVSLLLLKGACV